MRLVTASAALLPLGVGVVVVVMEIVGVFDGVLAIFLEVLLVISFATLFDGGVRPRVEDRCNAA